MDLEIARDNMIKQQIRSWNVLSTQTLNALESIKREFFVPTAYKKLAFADVRIPLWNNEIMLEPKLSARMMESLELKSTDRVLEIGTGTGYLTALLATVSKHVTSLEIDEDLYRHAALNLKIANIQNSSLIHADCHDFCQNHDQKYTAILINGSMPKITTLFTNLMEKSGRLIGIEGYHPAMHVVQYKKQVQPNFSDFSLKKVYLLETSVRRLRNTVDKSEFIF